MSRKPNYNKASLEAARLLEKYGYDKPPIDPELIAESEGLNVVYADFEEPFDEEVSGFFRLRDKTIVVNNSISGNRILFTIAHELGHHVLHQDFIRSNDYIPMPRNNEYPNGKPVEEVEADTFAANLLVPLKALKKYREIASIDELASLFFVSRDVIVNRLDLLSRYPNFAK